VAPLVERVATEGADLYAAALRGEDGDADADDAVPRVLRILGAAFGLREATAHELVNDLLVATAEAEDAAPEIGVADGLNVEGDDAAVEQG
jgi:hypothetical protein